jgi:nucleoside-diphosphate-sugar epimerase
VKTLVLGGTKFLGRHVVEVALARGHEVTIFHRGETNPGLFPEVEELLGDRDGDLAPLAGRRFDAVVDTSGYVPRVVRASAELLADSRHYAFVSTGNVYADFAHGPLRENDPLAELGELAEDDPKAYGPLKAQCESVALEVFRERALVARSGLLVGAHDPTGRFTYWPHRARRGGLVLAPTPPDRLVQFIDARDTATWLVRMAENQTGGVYNVAGPPIPFGHVLETCRAVTANGVDVVWVDHEFLVEQRVAEWTELPLWIADRDGKDFMNMDISRALGAGLEFRPLEETVEDALTRAETVDGIGLAPEREAKLLAECRDR